MEVVHHLYSGYMPPYRLIYGWYIDMVPGCLAKRGHCPFLPNLRGAPCAQVLAERCATQLTKLNGLATQNYFPCLPQHADFVEAQQP